MEAQNISELWIKTWNSLGIKERTCEVESCPADINFKASVTHFNVKLHFGDEQFEVDAAQLPIAFTQMTLRSENQVWKQEKHWLNALKENDVILFPKQQ